MSAWIVVAAVGLGSYLLRVVPMLVMGRITVGRRTEEAIGHAGLAALAALVVVTTRSAAHGPSGPAALAAVGLGVALAARGASMLRLVLVGGALYAAIRFGIGSGR